MLVLLVAIGCAASSDESALVSVDATDSLRVLEDLLADGRLGESDLLEASLAADTADASSRAGRLDLLGGAGTSTSRCSWSNDGTTVGWKFRRTEAASDHRGFLIHAASNWRAGIGYHSLSFGYGLLIAAAGGWNALSAGGSLLPAKSTWRGYAGSATGYGLWGSGLELSDPGRRVRVLRVRDQRSVAIDARGTTITTLDLDRGDDRLAILLLRDPAGRGWSLAAAGGEAAHRLALEISGWRPTGAGGQTLSAAIGATIDGRLWRLSAQAVGMNAAEVSPYARRPASLKIWGAGSWAISGRWRPSSSQTIKLLVAGHGAPARAGNGFNVRGGSVIALEMTSRLDGGLRIDSRLKRSRQAERGWRDLSDWLPPAPSGNENRLGVTTTIDWRPTAREYRLSHRYLLIETVAEDGASSSGNRSLLSFRIRRYLERLWRFDATLAWAWGGTADLMSVAAPASGVIMPLHWGHWREGLALGLSREAGQLVVGAGLIYRVGESSEPVGNDAPRAVKWLISMRRKW